MIPKTELQLTFSEAFLDEFSSRTFLSCDLEVYFLQYLFSSIVHH